MYRCPEDKKLVYYVRFCKEMQRTGIRTKCLTCIHFHEPKKKKRKVKQAPKKGTISKKAIKKVVAKVKKK